MKNHIKKDLLYKSGKSERRNGHDKRSPEKKRVGKHTGRRNNTMFQKVNKRITAFVLFAIMLISTVAATLTAYAVNGEKKTEVTAAETKESDFSSKRLIVMTDDESVIQGKGSVIGEYGEVYLLQFETAKEAMEAYASLKDKVTAVEPDIVVEAASTNKGSDIQINETENPVEALNGLGDAKASKNNHGVIALIDTGVKKHDNVIDRVSVADDALEGNGHGDAMVKAIVSQDQDAKILSIRAMDDEGFGTISSLVAAMEYAIAQDVDIINLSVYARTTLSTSVLKQEILKADEAGITVVGAAGNDGADASEYMPGAVEEGKLMITSKNMRVGVPATDGKEWLYPNRFEVKAENELFRDILKTSHALSKSGGNSLMESYHLEIHKQGFKVTALDGHRISIVDRIEGDLCQDIVLEGKLVQDAFSLTDGKVLLQTDGEDIRLIGEDFILSGKTRPEKYFRIDQITNSVSNHCCEAKINVAELKGALDVSTIIEPITILTPKEGCLEVQPKASADGEGVFSIPAEVTGSIDGKAALNGRYLIDALMSLDSETATIKFVKFNSSYAVTIDEDGRLEFIMPVMIR